MEINQLNNSNILFSHQAIPNIWTIRNCKIELLNGGEIALLFQNKRTVHDISSVRLVDGRRWTNLREHCDSTAKVLQEVLNRVKDIGFNSDGGRRDNRIPILFMQPYDWDEIGVK